MVTTSWRGERVSLLLEHGIHKSMQRMKSAYQRLEPGPRLGLRLAHVGHCAVGGRHVYTRVHCYCCCCLWSPSLFPLEAALFLSRTRKRYRPAGRGP